MSSEPPKRSLPHWILLLANARFFTASALLHVVIVMLVGGIVLYRHTGTPPDFTAGDGNIISDDVGDSGPPDPPSEQEAPQFEPSAPALPSLSVDAIVTSATTPTAVAIVAPAPSNLLAKMDAVQSVGKGLAERLASAAPGGGMPGGGMPGGTMKFFGNKTKLPAALVGTFYDLKQTSHKKPTGISPDEYHKTFRRFVGRGWNESMLNEYFKSAQPLYATQIMIPNMKAEEGPKAFGLEKEVQPSRWLVHYQCRVSPPADGNYHFVGAGDDVMVVRFNGKVVLDRCWYQQDEEWHADQNYNYGWTGIPNGFARGDRMQLRAGQFYEMEVLIGEQPGGLMFACLLIEKEGAHYRQDGKGNPILPPFRLADAPMPELTEGQTLPPYEPKGPVWTAATAGGSALDVFHKN